MRINGMGLGSIPLDKIHWYANEELGLDYDERTAFIWIMRRVDTHFLNVQAERAARSNK